MNDSIVNPDYCTERELKEILNYLDEVQNFEQIDMDKVDNRSIQTMNRYLMRDVSLNFEDRKEMLFYWLTTFSERHGLN